MLEFYDYDNFSGYISIYKNYLLLNKNLVNTFNDCYRIRIACDKENKKLYLFKLNKDEALSGIYSESSLLKLSITKSYGRISNSNVIDFICNVFKFNIPKEGFLKFNGRYDNQKKVIIADMEEAV